MVTEMINFDHNEFKINDLEVDHEDPILKQEVIAVSNSKWLYSLIN